MNWFTNSNTIIFACITCTSYYHQPQPFSNTEACGGSAGGEEEEEEEEEFDWQVEQEVYMESSGAELASLQKYGFGNQRSGVFARLQVMSQVEENIYLFALLTTTWLTFF